MGGVLVWGDVLEGRVLGVSACELIQVSGKYQHKMLHGNGVILNIGSVLSMSSFKCTKDGGIAAGMG